MAGLWLTCALIDDAPEAISNFWIEVTIQIVLQVAFTVNRAREAVHFISAEGSTVEA
jgi:hypothetical protein